MGAGTGEEPVTAANIATEPVMAALEESMPQSLARIPIIAAKASSQQSLHPADNAIDVNKETLWNSGANAPQWIEVELSGDYHLQEIRLLVAQYPNGPSFHRVFAAGQEKDYRLLTEFSGDTEDGQILTFQAEQPSMVRFLKIETIKSPSWIAWKEIEVYGYPAQTEPGDSEEPVEQPDQTADVIFINGSLLTMEESKPSAEAMAIYGQKIMAVGKNEEMSAFKGNETRVIDLKGKTLMPGFIDTHAHIFDRLGNSYQEAQLISLQNGITSTAEFFVNQDIYDRLKDFENSGDQKMRVALYLAFNSSCGEVIGNWYEQYPPSRDPRDKMRVTGVKIYGDGGDCNIPAYSFDFPGLGKGDLYFEKDELVEVFRDADAKGYQIAIHTLGDRSLDVILDAYDELLAGRDNPLRHRIEHNAVVRPDQMDRFWSNHLVISVFGAYPVCRRTDPVNPLKFIIPEEYESWEWPYQSMIDANPSAVFVWQSDSPLFGLQLISPINQLYGLAARAEIAEDGHICQAPPGLYEESVEIEKALKMMTIDAAYALFLENEVGSLVPGKYADIVMLSENPLNMAAEDIHRLEVQMTMVDGGTVFCGTTDQTLCP